MKDEKTNNIHIPDVGEKVFPSDEWIENEARKYSVDDLDESISRVGGFIVGAKCVRDAFLKPSNTLILTDGTTVDLTKPYEVYWNGSWQDGNLYHFIGYSIKGNPIFQSRNSNSIMDLAIRNKPEPEFKAGDKVWYSYKNDSGLSYYHIGTYSDNGEVVDQDGEIAPNVTIRPAFIDGKPVYPPFND